MLAHGVGQFLVVMLLHCLRNTVNATANPPKFSATTTWTFTGSTLPTGLSVSAHLVGAGPGTLARRFVKENVQVSGGYLNLIVPGGQTGKTIRCGEVATDFNILYASIRTYAILSQPPGVCNGLFMYESDTQETDIEWLSDPNSKANNGKAMLHYTNQAINGSGDASTFSGNGPATATSEVHEYRLDWTKSGTSFYVDGVLKRKIASNVPSQPGRWLWDNWSNGNPNWSSGPPATNATLKISKIVMYYNPA